MRGFLIPLVVNQPLSIRKAFVLTFKKHQHETEIFYSYCSAYSC